MLLRSLLILGLGVVACKTAKVTPTEKPKISIGTNFTLNGVATDKQYGFFPDKPIKIGCTEANEGVRNEQRFLAALAGPNGEIVKWRRKQNCCAFKTDNPLALAGSGMLDVYEVKVADSNEIRLIYINMYDCGPLLAPVGFTVKELPRLY
ncbi:hypothetical protein [Fibrella arboris]|uniref:hypothetical protein n=1 Tax=Fibrella arboris TaxID=3242486 RepID=UPI003522BA52